MLRFILLLLLTPYFAQATNTKITVSSQPIANIVGLLNSNTEIDTLSPSGACPHEYILKPSDFNRAKNSNFVIYTSDVFEPFIKPITMHSSAKIINLSHSLGITHDHNMHIWMSLENVKKAISVIANALQKPDTQALEQIDELIIYKKAQLSKLQSVLLLSDSLEYLFEDMPHVTVEKLYIKPGMTSAKDIVVLSNQHADKCIIINDKENVESIASKIGHKVIGVASEDWSLDGYKKIVDDIRDDCVSQL